MSNMVEIQPEHSSLLPWVQCEGGPNAWLVLLLSPGWRELHEFLTLIRLFLKKVCCQY